ncbi:hypothetical protein K6119_11435 [Paracrocinitomix mangrovi]|uniref:hypothetical protein n=1 Tax=Paracrocinitomix mangrovi TaxID=2862509 RepID=UPI001C8F112D|nr:hypothetical protein [Paracrocinitomix mangrovi]UKN00347.1 hypothetical protein K6119_11435 [Paracrocinitomix mangrovi]
MISFLFLACGQQESEETSNVHDSIITESTDTLFTNKISSEIDWDVALSFINDYRDMEDVLHAEEERLNWVDNDTRTSTNFKLIHRKMYEDARKADELMGLDYVAIFNAQDYPDQGFEIAETNEQDSILIVRGIDWTTFEVQLKLIYEEGSWKVDGAGDVNMQ